MNAAQSELAKPSTFITAEQARTSTKQWSSYDVFKSIADKAEAGQQELVLPWSVLAPETIALLGAGEYKLRRGGIKEEMAVISW